MDSEKWHKVSLVLCAIVGGVIGSYGTIWVILWLVGGIGLD